MRRATQTPPTKFWAAAAAAAATVAAAAAGSPLVQLLRCGHKLRVSASTKFFPLS